MQPVIAESQQSTDTVLMVSPSHFQFNHETASNNPFQKKVDVSNEMALKDFNSMVDTLRKNGIRVIVMPSRQDVETPDSVFPNNWFSVHATDQPDQKVLIVYSMSTKNRRVELQPENLIELLKREKIHINSTIDLSSHHLLFLEGTGSLVLDRVNKIAYAAISPRTNPEMVHIFAKKMNYKPVTFHCYDKHERLIYHTNVMLSVGTHFAVVALDSITRKEDRDNITKELKATNKEIIPITLEQIYNMAGNILEVKSTDGKTNIIMSEMAYGSYSPEQRDKLSKYGRIITVNIKNIETVGGGSARCMMAEIF